MLWGSFKKPKETCQGKRYLIKLLYKHILLETNVLDRADCSPVTCRMSQLTFHCFMLL